MSHQIHAKHAFGGGFVSLKVKAKPQQQLSKSRRVLSAKTRSVIALYFCVYVLGHHQLILRKFTQGWRGCILGDPGAVSRAGRKGAMKVFGSTDCPWVSEDGGVVRLHVNAS